MNGKRLFAQTHTPSNSKRETGTVVFDISAVKIDWREDSKNWNRRTK